MVDPPSSHLTVFVVVAVTSVWSVVLLVSLYTHDYEPLLYVSAPMVGVIGYVTGVTIARNGKK